MLGSHCMETIQTIQTVELSFVTLDVLKRSETESAPTLSCSFFFWLLPRDRLPGKWRWLIINYGSDDFVWDHLHSWAKAQTHTEVAVMVMKFCLYIELACLWPESTNQHHILKLPLSHPGSGVQRENQGLLGSPRWAGVIVSGCYEMLRSKSGKPNPRLACRMNHFHRAFHSILLAAMLSSIACSWAGPAGLLHDDTAPCGLSAFNYQL